MRPLKGLGKLVCPAALALTIGVTSFAASQVNAEVVAPGAVKITDGKLDTSLTGKPGDAAAGKKWFVGRKLGNCLACHVNKDTASEQFHGEVGPAMTVWLIATRLLSCARS